MERINRHTRSPSVPTSVSDEEELAISQGLPNHMHAGDIGGGSAPSGRGDGQEVLIPDFAFYRYNIPNTNNMGVSYYSGIAPFPGDSCAADLLTEVRDEKTGEWGPLPAGYCAPRRLDGDREVAEEVEEGQTSAMEQGSDPEPDSTLYCSYRYNFPKDTGLAYYPGIPPFPGNPGAADRLTEVRDEKTGEWGPLPAGHCAPRRSDGDEEEAAEAEEQGQSDHESTPTASDYSDNRKVQEKDRARRRSRGKSVSDTEEEDAEDDRDFANDAIPKKAKAPTSRFTKAQKGKGRERGGAEHSAHGSPSKVPTGRHKTPRGYSKEEVEEISAFGQGVAEEADILARKWNRQHRDVMVRAGLGMRLSRKGNTYNEYRAWYASVHHKGPESMWSYLWFKIIIIFLLVTRDAWNEIMTREYHALMEGLNTDERKVEMQQIQDDYGTSAVGADAREPVTRVKAYVKQFEGLVRIVAYCLVVADIPDRQHPLTEPMVTFKSLEWSFTLALTRQHGKPLAYSLVPQMRDH
jgi:uncharacterized protein YgiB involved in biofilm formation